MRSYAIRAVFGFLFVNGGISEDEEWVQDNWREHAKRVAEKGKKHGTWWRQRVAIMSERLTQEEMADSEARHNIPKDDRGRRAKVSDTAERVAGACTFFHCGVFVRCAKCRITVHPVGYRRCVKICTGDSRIILRRPCPKCGILFGNSGCQKHVDHCGFEKKRVKRLIRTDRRRVSSELLRKRMEFKSDGPDAEAQRKIEIETVRRHLGKRRRQTVIAEPEKIRKRLRGKQKPGLEWMGDEVLPAPRPVQIGGSSSSSAPAGPPPGVHPKGTRAMEKSPEAPSRFKNQTSSTNNCPLLWKARRSRRA